jgi:DNA-binding MarR family transcriptional regulator
MIERRLDRLQALMERMLGAMLRMARPACGEVDLSPQQFMMLKLLDDEGPMSIRSLRERTQGAQSTLSEMVGRLARLGYVSKRRDTEDRRAVRVAITAAARAVMKARQMEFRARSGMILSALSVDDQDRYLEAVETLVTLIERAVSRDGGEAKKEAD